MPFVHATNYSVDTQDVCFAVHVVATATLLVAVAGGWLLGTGFWLSSEDLRPDPSPVPSAFLVNFVTMTIGEKLTHPHTQQLLK